MGRIGRATVALLLIGSATFAAAATPAANEGDQVRADALIAAINGTRVARSQWIEANVIADGRDKVRAQLETLATRSGGLTLVRTRLDGPIDKLYVRAKGGTASRIDLLPDEKQGAQVGALFSFPWPEPYPFDAKAALAKAGGSLEKAIEERVRFSADRADFSGTVLVRGRDGRVIYSHSFGLADRDHNVANALHTRYNLGSMDKMFTAVAIAQLVESGKLTLDTRLLDVLPDYPGQEAAKAITIRHLLMHSAGLGGLFDRPKFEREKDYGDMTHLLPVFASEPLEFPPGTRGSYSNEGFVVLGAVIERISGKTYYEYVAQHVFAPLGMNATASLALDEVAPDRAVGYRFKPDDLLGTQGRGPNWTFLPYRGSSAGGGYATATDMLNFLTALREGRLVSRGTAELFTALNQGGEEDYGMGFNHVVKGGRTLRGHNGGGPGSGINSEAMIVWETGDAYAVMGNLDAPFAQILGSDIAELLVAARL